MSAAELHRDGWCGTDCPVCEYEDNQPATYFADDDADNDPTIWVQRGDDQPQAVLRMSRLEPGPDRETHWEWLLGLMEGQR